MFYHCSRDGTKGFKNHKNESINPELSHLNRNLAPERPEGLYRFTVDRCKDLGILNRKNVNYCCSWTITSPKEIQGDTEKEDLFHREVYNWLSSRYNEENVIASFLHKDEKNIHQHFLFIPVKYTYESFFNPETLELLDIKKAKVNAKEIIDRTELKQIHSLLNEYLKTALPFSVDVNNGSTVKGVKNIEQYKEYQDLQKEIKDLRTNTVALHNYVSQLKKEKDATMEIVSNLLNSYTSIAPEETIEKLNSSIGSVIGLSNSAEDLYSRSKQKEKKQNAKDLDFEI